MSVHTHDVIIKYGTMYTKSYANTKDMLNMNITTKDMLNMNITSNIININIYVPIIK